MSDISTDSGDGVRLGASADVSHVPPSNAAGADASASIGAVSFQCPPFWVSNPRAWFLHLESAFALKGITRQLVKYQHVVSALPQAVTEEVLDILENIPSEAPYDILKTAIIKRTTSSDKERIRKLFHDTQLGDQKPSQLLRRMRSLAGNPQDEKILGELWFEKLPQPIAATLATSKRLPLDEIADMADTAMEYWGPLLAAQVASCNKTSTPAPTDPAAARIAALEAQVAHLTSRLSRSPSRDRSSRGTSRSPSRRSSSPRMCWYHERFGNSAKNCVGNCTFRRNSSPSENERAGR